MKQQTAVDLLKSEILLLEHMLPSHKDAIIKFLKQAKQMEKEQIKDAFDEGENREFYKRPQAEQYYNETYGNN